MLQYSESLKILVYQVAESRGKSNIFSFWFEGVYITESRCSQKLYITEYRWIVMYGYLLTRLCIYILLQSSKTLS